MNPHQASITAAFLVIAVLLAARHATWLGAAVAWIRKPVEHSNG